jgi:hypothetical protein
MMLHSKRDGPRVGATREQIPRARQEIEVNISFPSRLRKP